MGFRPFFLSAALLAALALPLWLFALYHGLEHSPPIGWFRWHIHEMLFGVIVAVIAGFTTTAVPKWTQTEPLSGAPLLVLWLTWLAGRIAALTLSPLLLAAVDLVFMGALLTAVGLPIVVRRNQRNYKILAILALIAVCQTLFLIGGEYSGEAYRATVWWVALLIAIIGSRILPGFTANGLSQQMGRPMLPPLAGRLDHVPAIGIATVAVLDMVGGYSIIELLDPVVAIVSLTAAAVTVRNSLRWQGSKTARVPLLWSLHLGYLWLAAGLLLHAASLWPGLPRSMVIHAFTAGAMGTMVLAMMTRVSRGHSGLSLIAGPADVGIYALVLAGSLFRVVAGFGANAQWMMVSGVLWSAAFALFAVAYARTLCQPRL